MSNNTLMAPQLPVYPPGDEQTRAEVAFWATIVLTFFGMACVALRIYTRACIVRNIGKEDWTMMVAAALTLVFGIQMIIHIKAFKMGFSGSSLTMDQLVESSKLGLAEIGVYKTTVTLIKVSILLIYLRLSVTKTFEWLCKGSIALLLTYQGIVLTILPLECIPLEKMWDFTGTVPGVCIDTATFYFITSGFHILMDLWILLLPYKLIFSIPRPLRERLGVYAVFGLGILSTLCAVARFHFLVVALHSTDPYYDSLGVNVWSIIEVNVGILCASMPTLRPLISRAQRRRTRKALNLPEKRDKLDKSDTALSSPRSPKRGALLSVKEMFISLGSFTQTALTMRSAKDAEYDDEDWHQAPPVPPKDELHSPIRSPEMAHHKAYPQSF